MLYNIILLKEIQKLQGETKNFDLIVFITNEIKSQEIPIINSSFIEDNTLIKEFYPHLLSTTLNKLLITNTNNLNETIYSKINEEANFKIKIGDNIAIKELQEKLENIGYHYDNSLQENFSYSIRGNIVDIYTTPPIRIELNDNQIESIRIFNPKTFLSVKKINYATITPKKNTTILNTILNTKKNINILFLSDLDEEIAKNIIEREIKKQENTININFSIKNISFSENFSKFQKIKNIFSLDPNLKKIFSNNTTYQKYIELITEYLKIKRKQISLVENTEILDIEALYGFIDNQNKIAFITEKELSKDQEKIDNNIFNSIQEFKEGDLVVVEGYGIGIYLGTQKIKVAHYQEKEFLAVQFKNNRKIYFAIESVNLHKYFSTDNNKIKEKILSVPSFKSWQKKIEKVYQNIKEIGDTILKINAKRFSTQSIPIKEMDNPIDEQEIILTKDQEKVMNEIFKDFQEPFPSNRLILADTGYGKTEIILRAINRVLSNNYKAILFCPTTILSYQHYINFQKRLKNFKISIKTSILKNFTSLNETDLLISTPFDVTKYKEKLNTNKVALVVLDEEQLFGVMFKEFLKEIFPQAHFLYTSATPIPRTFFLATTGIIDLSIINTPPPTYNTPQTIILTFSSKNHKLLLIQKIINSSNSKKIIIINNDIDELYEMWKIMSQLNLKISIIHSKLNSKEIEQTFIKFIQGKVDIILSTTIIQSGIDTPEFDIMIIDNSQMLGISQLYQLRGRITRSNKNPKCYILLDQKYTYTDSFERISIFEKEDLSNLEVVQKDLDLRGPGSILSKKQSGYIQEIGLIQFVKLINQYLNKEEKLPIIECEDKTYLPDSPMKNKIYRQLLTAKNIQELEYIKKEIIDIYGKELPEPTVNLLKVIEYRIKNKGKKTKIKVKIINGEVVEV